LSYNKHNHIEEVFELSAQNAQRLRESKTTVDQLIVASNEITQAYKNGGCLHVAGNGGSAADSQHLVAELVSKLYKDRTPIKAFALTVDTSILTAIGNDYGYEFVFERQVRAGMSSNDVFLGITTSGNSRNILAALKACKEIGARSIVLTGPSGGECKGLADILINTPGTRTDKIQENHLVVYHTLCELIEKDLVELGLCNYKK
jgi:D-sedoheptulose 7-phosphate isomerase